MDDSSIIEPGLRRRLGVVGLTPYGVGVTVGAGIYVLVGKVAGFAGDLSPLAFLIAAVVAGLTAMSFAELAVRFPRSAGEAIYVREGFGSRTISIFTGLGVAAAGLVSAGAVVVGSAGYIGTLIPLPGWAIQILLVALLAVIAVWGIAQSVAIVGLVTVLETGGLLLILTVAVPGALDGAAVTAPAAPSLDGVMAAVVIAFFAFIGFEDMVNVAEEVKEPERTMPRAIVATLVITTLLYVALAWVSSTVVGADALAASDAPLSRVFEQATGWSAAPFAVLAAFATLNGALVLVIMGSRIFYGMACQGSMPRVLGRVWSVTGTPVAATFAAAAVVLVCALALPIGALAQVGSVLTLTVFTVVNIALIAIKRHAPAAPGAFKVPGWWPWLAALASGGVLAGEVVRVVL